jgi:hypothetical protein
MADKGDRKDRIARLLNPTDELSDPKCGPAGAVSVNGNHNTIALYGAKIVVRGPAKAPESVNGKIKQKKTTWREELEGLIWQRVWDLGMTSEQFYELAGKELRRPVFSLAKVSERNLGVLYEMLANMRRPALD